jgi:Zn-dependent peptidase ImmA (M78 family)/transcriptional regulator with XRE-family HTH domain
MSKSIPVNPDVLRWARETAGWNIEEVARRMGKSADMVLSWESGERSPTYLQLDKLAYEIYKRPIALFFFPEPPKEETPKQSFRTLPEHEISRMGRRLRYLIRQARVMQINLAELNDDVNPASRQILHDLSFNPSVDVHEMAANVRKYLDIDLFAQKVWKNTDEAFKAWRNTFEKHGVFVFKEAFRDDAFSGFCLYDDQFPVIYINNSKPYARQIFTLFHELAHLLLGTGGVDTRLDDYIYLLTGDDRKIEILCNQFTGSFLVPDHDFDRQISKLAVNDEVVERLAGQYQVSREVILRKFLDRNSIDQSYYEEKVKQWARRAGKKSSFGGDYYRTKGAYLGDHYLEMAFGRYYQKRISIEQLANYLGVKVKYVVGVESILFNRGTAA